MKIANIDVFFFAFNFHSSLKAFLFFKLKLAGAWSPAECRLVWVNVCHPRINQNKWTPTENNNLIELARKYKERNWEKIAQEMNVFLFTLRIIIKLNLKVCQSI